jgi:hypothetical protein
MLLSLFLAIMLVDQTKISPDANVGKIDNTTPVEGYYLVKGPSYKGVAYVKRVTEKDAYIVQQYAGDKGANGIGMFVNSQLVVGWTQGEAKGVTSIRFTNGVGRASWVSNPGNGFIGHETWTLIPGGEED